MGRSKRSATRGAQPPAQQELNLTMHQLLAIDIVRAFADHAITHLAGSRRRDNGVVLNWNSMKLSWTPPMGKGTVVKLSARLEESTIVQLDMSITFHDENAGMAMLTAKICWKEEGMGYVAYHRFARRDDDGRISITDPEAATSAA